MTTHVCARNKLHPPNKHTRPFTVLSIIVAIVVQDSYKIIIFDELYTFYN
jgi:hypothetical protein